MRLGGVTLAVTPRTHNLDLTSDTLISSILYLPSAAYYNEWMSGKQAALAHLQIRNPKDDEAPIEATTQIFSSLIPGAIPWSKALFEPPVPYSFELLLLSQRIYFYVTCDLEKQTFMKSLITSSYPNAAIMRTKDPMEYVYSTSGVEQGDIALTSQFYLPIKTISDFGKIDPLTSILGFLARSDPHQTAAIQILVSPATFAWQKQALKLTEKTGDELKDAANRNVKANLINQKVAYQGGKVLIRLVSGHSDKGLAGSFIRNLAGTFGAYSLAEGNQLSFKKAEKPAEMKRHILTRTHGYFERRSQILNAAELTGLWHLPGSQLAGIKNLAWGKSLSGEPPENIALANEMSDEEKQDVNFFATTEFKNQEQIFGIKTKDRRKHIYIIGKTGSGKSTLISNMAIDDIRRGRGVGIIDPHGDLTESILDYIPKRRVNDVVYLEAFDKDRPFHLNILQVRNEEQKHLVASGIVSIFQKMYGHSWGPRLEYILRNVILTLVEVEGATLYDALRLMSDDKYRKKTLEGITDTVLLNFWHREFDVMQDRQRTEAIAPIQNKLGQFVTSTMIRNIVANPKSSIDLAEIMDSGKILLLNLSQGKLGEDNAALLGAMIITQIQLAAMGRSFQKEEDRRDFFLYVDEFQNFATGSFIKILSEARKYRLALTLANQYIDQLDEEVRNAIFGNAGTIVSFVVGARDAAHLTKEFSGVYSDNDLVELGKYEIVLKLSVDNMTTSPFPARTLPPPKLSNDNREKIIRMSKEKYGRKQTTV